MFRRSRNWHHGHSLATGALVGLLISYRPWIIFAAGVLVGLLIAATYSAFKWLHTSWLWKRSRTLAAAKLGKPKPERVDLSKVPVYDASGMVVGYADGGRVGPTDKVPF